MMCQANFELAESSMENKQEEVGKHFIDAVRKLSGVGIRTPPVRDL